MVLTYIYLFKKTYSMVPFFHARIDRGEKWAMVTQKVQNEAGVMKIVKEIKMP